LSTSSVGYALATASGLLLALSFPKYGHPAFGWIALAPLLVALARVTLRRAFLLGLVTGCVYFTGTLYWITHVMVTYGDIHFWVAVLINAALVAYLALFPAIFALVMRRVVMKHGQAAMMAAPLVWVATELGRTHVFTGFPWVLLGYSQTTVLPIAQLGSVFGVYGVSMLVAAMSAALAVVAAGAPRALRYGPGRFGSAERFAPLVVVVAILVGVAFWGSRRATASEWTHTGEAIRVGLIQGNVDQAEKMGGTRAGAIFQDYMTMTRQAIREGAEFILWPESSTPFLFEVDVAAAEQVRTLARQARVSILFGSDQVERGEHGSPMKYFNSAFLVRPDGSTGGVYRKIHLVPFGEYVPGRSALPFLAMIVGDQVPSDFAFGTEHTVFHLTDGKAHVAPLICFEDTIGDLTRQFVLGGANLLANVTNDGWFLRSAGSQQHLDNAVFRCVETRRPMVRAANTGVTCFISEFGRITQRLMDDTGSQFTEGVLISEVAIPTGGKLTFYTRHGELFAKGCAGVTMMTLLACSIQIVRRKRSREATPQIS
jgi:apolipoprotein N-acyltransferase